jgi:serine/threonine-protein kinase
VPDQLGRIRAALEGRYAIARELGAGGMATVYLADDLKHGRKVAVKVLKPELAAALGPDRFPREIRILARLQHPHILPLLDSGESEGFLFYTMPYIEGESLRQRIDRAGPIGIQEAVRITREVADALASAHAAGILHRDIKPGNVLISGRHALVMDFGIAKALSDSGGDTLTTIGIAVGTPAYMSPEQATGADEVDARSDIYALGTLAYEMITGAPPFQRKTTQATLAAQVLDKPPPLTEVHPAANQELSDLVMRCLEKDPANRWQTSDELVPLLEALATPSGGMTPTQTRPVKTVAPATSGPTRSGNRRPAIGVLAILAIVVGLYGGWRFVSGRRAGGAPSTDTITRVAVMPLRDISGADATFAESMQDALITTIGAMNVVGVVSASELSEKGQSRRIHDVATEFNVNAVMEGTLFRAGDVMRINLQLVEPLSVHHYWTGSYEMNVKNVLAAQDSLIRTIDAELRGVLDGTARKTAATNPSGR